MSKDQKMYICIFWNQNFLNMYECTEKSNPVLNVFKHVTFGGSVAEMT